MMSTPSLWLANSYRDTASPSLESIEDEKYLASANPKLCLGWGSSTDFTACFRKLLLTVIAFASCSRIARPAGANPNAPDTMTKSPGFAPFLVGTLNLGKPIMVQSITSSPASFVSPPTILTPNSFDAIAKPSASPSISGRRVDELFGMPSEITAACGLTPLAARSLMHETILFRAACQGFIPLGTSVLATSISLLITIPLSISATSSRLLIPSLFAKIRIICFSSNLVIHFLDLFGCHLVNGLCFVASGFDRYPDRVFGV